MKLESSVFFNGKWLKKETFENEVRVSLSSAFDTGCPFLQCLTIPSKNNNYDEVYFVAREHDPCPLRKCGWRSCRNYGKPYDNQERLLILVK